MPTLNKKSYKKPYYKKQGRSLEASKIYTSKDWQKLRNAYYMQHPICEICEYNGITKPCEEVHHILPILSTDNPLERLEIALNPNNLISLCADCHHKIHHNKIDSSIIDEIKDK